MTYPGGKNGGGAYQRIINYMPPHDTYVELFLGSGAVIRHKRTAFKNIGIDLSQNAIQLTKQLAPKTIRVEYQNISAFTFLAQNTRLGLNDDALIYADPPYLPETRKSGDLYEFEMSKQDHEELLYALKQMSCMVMISGYRSKLYDAKLRNWTRIDYKAVTRQGMVDEALWMNFDPPKELHDYRYLGDNFRERERIKRKKERWKNRLEKMDRLERLALMDALNGL